MKKETAAWVRKAEGDFQAVRMVANMKPSIPLHMCYHCQQCTEKYLQALLVEAGKPGPRIRDLLKLHELVLLQDSSLIGLRRGLSFVTQFADDEGFPVDQAIARQARSALRWTTRVREEIRKRLKLPI
jgi:hypothetical protein